MILDLCLLFPVMDIKNPRNLNNSKELYKKNSEIFEGFFDYLSLKAIYLAVSPCFI